MTQPKVTIVIPVYNGSNYMREAIDSALAQSYENIEVIVVNDGSQDDSEEIALSYGDKIRYFSKENGGVSTALNVGIENMTGEYFQYLPHDDLLHPDKIRLQMEAIKKSGNEMSIAWSGWNVLCEPEHRLVLQEIPPWYPRFNWTKKTYPVWFGLASTVTILLNRKYFELVGTFDPDLYTSQDYDMWYRTFCMQDSVYVDEPLMTYRVHTAQGTQVDEDYKKNCEDLAVSKLRSVTVGEIEDIFPSRFKFFYELLKYYRGIDWEEPFQYAKEQFSRLDEPEAGVKIRTAFAEKLYAGGREVVLYGAGSNGIRLKNELWMHGIQVSAFCDANPQKVGTEVEGISCISRAQLSDGHTVIISIDHPEAVREELKAYGVKEPLDYRAVAEELWTACPIKERVLQLL